jgi:hypothetical protein
MPSKIHCTKDVMQDSRVGDSVRIWRRVRGDNQQTFTRPMTSCRRRSWSGGRSDAKTFWLNEAMLAMSLNINRVILTATRRVEIAPLSEVRLDLRLSMAAGLRKLR